MITKANSSMKNSKRPAPDPGGEQIDQEYFPPLNAVKFRYILEEKGRLGKKGAALMPLPNKDNRQPGFIPNTSETLLVGIGNNCRGDDGLGWAFLDRVNQWGKFMGQTEYRYQLQVEDAELISQFETVVFVDACKNEPAGGFTWEACRNAAEPEFTTHLLKPEAVVELCSQLYGNRPRVFLLAIAGKTWDIQKGVSPTAQRNLDKAFAAGFTI